MKRQGPAAGDSARSTDAEHLAGASHGARWARSRNSPIILLSYPYSGARRVQDLLADGTELACTYGTGIIPLCLVAAETWRRVERRDAPGMSQLAVSTIRALVGAQVTAILADTGKARWCELASADPSATRPFLQLFPHAVFVCVHRGCPDMIRAGVQASPWGLHGQGLAPYLLSYPGNSVAALAACWVNATEELLAFEESNSQINYRVRYEDVVSGSGEVIAGLRAWLGLGDRPWATFSEQSGSTEPVSGAQVPAEMIPPSLYDRIRRLHVKLGYAPMPG